MTVIKTLDERVEELEQKVRELEFIVKKSEGEGIINNIHCDLIQQPKVTQPQVPHQQVPHQQVPHQQVQQNPMPRFIYQEKLNQRPKTIKETIVGKYFIGALAALLVFIAAISLIGLVWNDLTAVIKLLLISSTGIILTGFGFWFIRRKNNAINAIILGTGSGLLFISILSADMAFHLISHNIAILLSCIWSIFFILSSRFINVFFTTIIAYIGSYIALSLGLSLLTGDTELLILTLFASAISSVMIYSAYKNKENHQLITSILLSFLSYSTILFRTVFDGLLFSDQMLKNYITQTIVLIITYILMNVLYKIVDRKKYFWNIGVGVVTTILTAFYFINLSSNYLHLEFITMCILFFIVTLIQMILSRLLLKETYKIVTIYYTFVLVCTSICINIIMFDVLTGIIIVALILMIIDYVTKRNDYDEVISFIILLDVATLFTCDEIVLSNAVYGALQIIFIFYMIHRNYKLKNYKHIDLLKIAGLITVIINSFYIPKHIIVSFMMKNDSIDFGIVRTIGYIIAVISFAVMIKLRYFHDWDTEDISDNELRGKFQISKNMRTLLLISSTVLYFIGLNGISDSNIWYQQLIFTMSTIVIAFIQTFNIIVYRNENEQLSEIWIGLKYFILSWTILQSVFSLELNSVAYSIIGLIIAILSISVGFMYKLKSLRLYGLILTIIMVIKFILIDLSEENSITRVISLIIGGLICFGISVLYNKLNSNIED